MNRMMKTVKKRKRFALQPIKIVLALTVVAVLVNLLLLINYEWTEGQQQHRQQQGGDCAPHYFRNAMNSQRPPPKSKQSDSSRGDQDDRNSNSNLKNTAVVIQGHRDHVLPYSMDQFRFGEANWNELLAADRVLHVLSHTHWDREWYLSLEQFRGSLIMELDRVFEMLSNSSHSNFQHFHMDGQYLMVEDYLQVRPLMKNTVAELNRRGKITLGPFYSSPDVFLSSGEALIRNLMLGMSLSSEMGGTSMVGYLPDTFGFMGQLPQLLQGVGVRYFVSGRFAKTGKTEGCWVGPDGSSVLFVYLGNWYCHATKLLSPSVLKEKGFAAAVQQLDQDLTKKGAQSKHRLAMAGCDHYMTDPHVGQNIKAMNDKAKSSNKTFTAENNVDNGTVQIVQTNIDDYMRLLESDIKGMELPIVRGEVRVGVDMLINSASTKMSVKQMNFKIQSLLEKWVEPMEAYGWALNRRLYDSDRIWHAWKPVLETHAHDSICSTSASSVIHDIVNRLSRSEQSTYRMLADQAGQIIPAILGKLAVNHNDQVVLVVNPTNTERSECFTVTLVFPLEKKHNGSFSGFVNLLEGRGRVTHPLVLASASVPKESFVLPFTSFRRKVWKRSFTYMGRISLPPNGIALLQLKEDALMPKQAIVETMDLKSSTTLENNHLFVNIAIVDGSCSLTHKESGQTWNDVNKIWRTTEFGTSYRHSSHLGNQELITRLQVVSKKESSFFSSIKLQGLLGASSAITITYVLFANSKGLQIETTVDNSERDSYVVASFPIRNGENEIIDNPTAVSVDADGNFEYVNRSHMQERYVHQNRFSSIYTSASSLTVANRGIPEYIVTTDKLRITLIRGVNKIGDWLQGALEDDVSQELGNMTFHYAVIPATCRVTDPKCSADLEARNFVDPLGTYASRVENGYRPERYIDLDMTPLSVVSGLPVGIKTSKPLQLDETELQATGFVQLFELKPTKLILSAVKKAESKDALVLRAYNPTNSTLQASLRPGLIKFRHVEHVLLNENKLDESNNLVIRAGENGAFYFTFGPYKIVTLLLFEM